MSLRDRIFGRALASSESRQEELSVATGVPVLGLDALASTGYGPEAALAILLPLGIQGLHYFRWVIFAVLLQLATLYVSYRQTAAAYSGGGGAYVVAKVNLDVRSGVWAAVALLVDYLLNVAVGIAAGVGAIVSAVPFLQPYTLWLCLLVLGSLTLLNLRGVRESGIAFISPVVLFIICLGVVLALGIFHILQTGGHPSALVAPPSPPPMTQHLSAWLLLGAFANGCTAMTGIEAVSNGVPLFREPRVPNAQRTLTVIMGVLSLFLLGIAFICPAYHIGAMNEQAPGYQTVLSQIVSAVAGRGIFYYVALTSIFIVLTYSAQTSFTDFPRVCRLLAEDRFLPPFYANRGRRLVYSAGILTLALLSGTLLVVFGGITSKLIPLFAIGAFGAFLFSQWGMVRHWQRNRVRGYRRSLALNAIGSVTTAFALLVIVIAKFAEGAWITLLVVPILFITLWSIHRHYQKLRRQLGDPLALACGELKRPIVIVPISGWDRMAEKAIEFALLLSDHVTAVHISTEHDDSARLGKIWLDRVRKPAVDANVPPPELKIIESPYRLVYEPVLDFINTVKSKHPDRFIAILIPQIVERHWYEYVLHNQYGSGLTRRLFEKRDDRTVLITVPWYFHEKRPSAASDHNLHSTSSAA